MELGKIVKEHLDKQEKLNSTQKRLMEAISEIEADYKRDASLAFLSRKYFVSKPTIKTFLIEKGIYKMTEGAKQ